MTSKQNLDGSPARRRMAGYTPLTTNQQVPELDATTPEPASAAVSAPHPVDPETPTTTSAPSQDVQSQTTPETAARKRRMGASPVSETTATAASAENAGPATSTPAAKTRMGGAPAAKTRMGGASVQSAAPTTDAAAPVASAPTGGDGATQPASPRKRMGAAPAAGAPVGATALQAATAPTRMAGATSAQSRVMSVPAPSAASSATSAASSGRSGASVPASAATPKAIQRPGLADRPGWVKPAIIIGGLLVVAILVVLGARWLRALEGVQEFIATYDGHSSQPDTAPVGMPAWLGWQHFLNMFFIVLIVRTGLQVRTERKPPAYWTAKKNSFFSPKGSIPKKVSLTQWLHQCLDVLWVFNGLIFIVLLFATGHWMRIVPMSWDLFPNMLSASIQYASLDWPTENGWIHYNALQVTAYFITVFIAAPLAILTGLRLSTWWPDQNERLNKSYPVEWARAVHVPVMLYFVAFTIVHVFLVVFTGALRNLNHMYTSRDVVDWWGLLVFLGSLVVIAAAWFLTAPLFTTPIAARTGKVSK